MSTSHSHKHVYVAIPIDVVPRAAQETSSSSPWNPVGSGAAAADDAISSRRSRAPPKDDPSTPPSPSSTSAGAFACFGAGSMLGILFSMAGFWVQEVYQFTSIFGYSLAWSCLTSVASYVLYYIWNSLFLGGHRSRTPPLSSTSARTTSVKSEYHFALGVFLGFCLACIVTDVLLRMPLRSILVTVTIAIAWAMVMAYCGTLEEHSELEEEVDDDDLTSSVARPSTQALLLRDRKGTVLPLVIV